MILLQTGFAQQDTSRTGEKILSDSVFVMQKSPWGAVLRSAVIPGVIWGVAAWLVYNWNINNKDYKNYDDLYRQTNDSGYKQLRDFYHDQRDLFAIYMGLTYFLNLVDAYVDAELFDFNVNENYRTGEPMLGIKIKF